MKRTIRSLSALALLAAAVSACAPGLPTGPVQPTPSQPPADGGANPSPSTPVGEQPGQEPSGGAVQTATLRGKVYDEQGAPVRDGEVIVKSLTEGQAFEAKAPILAGSYVMNEVPAGVLLQITARKDGWTQRSRVETLVGHRTDTAIDFGGPNSPYFLSDYPEVAAVVPAKDAEIAPGKLQYELTLSEPLEEVSRRRFENALRLLPANDAANGGAAGSTTELAAQEDTGFPFDMLIDGNAAVAPYAVKKGSTFGQDTEKRAAIAWSEDFRKATLVFDAPLIQSDDQLAAYQLVLVSEGASARITDAAGKQLGTNAAGSLSSYPGAGRLILSAFQAPNLNLSAITGLTAGSAEARWAATHLNQGAFKLNKDTTAPKLEALEVARIGDDTRLELMFSEPMAAYNGTTSGLVSAELGNDATDLANYTFALGKAASEIDGVKLDVASPAEVDPKAVASYGASADRGKAFRFAPNAFAASRAAAVQGSVVVEVDPLNARRVLLTIIDRPGFFHDEATAIKGRVINVADPAGNAITSRNADENVQTGSL